MPYSACTMYALGVKSDPSPCWSLWYQEFSCSLCVAIVRQHFVQDLSRVWQTVKLLSLKECVDTSVQDSHGLSYRWGISLWCRGEHAHLLCVYMKTWSPLVKRKMEQVQQTTILKEPSTSKFMAMTPMLC